MKIRMVGLVVCVSSLVGCGTGTLQKEGDFIRKGELFRAAMQKTDAVQKGGTALTAARLSSEEESILAERLSQAQKEADDICSEVVGGWFGNCSCSDGGKRIWQCRLDQCLQRGGRGKCSDCAHH